MNINVAQWIGKRGDQEDAYAHRHYPEGTLAVVCDGMGGHDCGSLAASTAANAFVEAFDTVEGDTIPARLRAALDKANDAVGELFKKRTSYGGTTLLAVYFGGGVMWWVSVGDSPLLIWRFGRLMRKNDDHSMRSIYGSYVSSGVMGLEEAMSQGHSLRSAVTGEKIPIVNNPATPEPLLPGDRIILASDGVDELLLPDLMLPEVRPETRQLLDARDGNLAAGIVEACKALELPTADNVTVLTLDWQ